MAISIEQVRFRLEVLHPNRKHWQQHFKDADVHIAYQAREGLVALTDTEGEPPVLVPQQLVQWMIPKASKGAK